MVNKRLTGGVNGLRPLCSVRGSPDWGGAQPEVKWLALISHTTNRGLTVWANGNRFRSDFVFPVRSDRSARAGRVSASKIARLAGGDGRAGSVCGPLLAVLARRSRLKRYRGPDAPWRRLSCMD